MTTTSCGVPSTRAPPGSSSRTARRRTSSPRPRVAGGAAWLDPKVAPRALQAFRTNVRPHLAEEARVAELTDREHDVLRHMARGATNAEIAAALS